LIACQIEYYPETLNERSNSVGLQTIEDDIEVMNKRYFENFETINKDLPLIEYIPISMKYGIAISLTLLVFPLFSQTGYKIGFTIKTWKDTTVYLGTDYGEVHNIVDTAQVKSGTFSFEGKKALAEGVYYLVLARTKLFDFVIGKNQHFALETGSSGYLKIDEYTANMKVKDDLDNQLFFEYFAFDREQRKRAEPYIKIIKDSAVKEDQKKEAHAGFSKVSEHVMAYEKELIGKNPTTMTARMLKASLPVTVPDPPKKPDGSIDSTFQFYFYRRHFFDNFDLADEALIHLPRPLYRDKLKEYLSGLFIPQPDTITKAINQLVAKVKGNKETYKYLVVTGTFMYQQPEIMGLDEVFVNMYDQYFATGEMDYWANAKIKQNLKEYADKIRSCMIGRVGANLIMQDQNFKPQALYDIPAKYKILFIFNPDCGHCREETPKLVEFYNKNKTKYNLEVYAVSSDTSMKKMRDFIKEFKTPWITVNGPRTYLEPYSKVYHADTTPTIYILDDKQKIIAKKLPVKQLGDFLSRHEKFVQTKKIGG
jgi:thiol-disulfide isomerase/thioredoxin